MKHYAPKRYEPIVGGGGINGCKPRIEVIVKMQKKVGVGSCLGQDVRVDVNQELK